MQWRGLPTVFITISVTPFVLVGISSPVLSQDVHVYSAAFTMVALVTAPTLTRLSRRSSTTLFALLHWAAHLAVHLPGAAE